MDEIAPLRLLLALAAIVGAAVLASLWNTPIASMALLGSGGLLAAYFLTPPASPRPASIRHVDALTEKRLHQAGRSEAYQDIIDPFDDPILLIRNAKVIMINQAGRQVLGGHVVGEDVRIAIRHPAAAERLSNADIENSSEPVVLVGVGTADQRWEMRVKSLVDGIKLVILTDKSERYAAEKMRTDFVANASHELRTPLTAIKGFAETLQDPDAGGDADTRDRFLSIMVSETERMQRLVEDLISLSRIEAEKFQLPSTPIDLPEWIGNVCDEIRNGNPSGGPVIVINSEEDLPAVLGDAAQLAQVAHNLISNAMKYGQSDKPVEVSIKRRSNNKMVVFAVRDYGDGIEAHHIPRLTERFYRADRSRSRKAGGTGLGLSIVKHITERHGGRLEIQSELGKGTAVSVHLPAQSPLQ
jgi:two-component system phosphate regulon sensor histidine kinase PhoR